MAKWKMREVGQVNYLTLEVNPSSYKRNKQVDVSYEQLVDGSSCRMVSPAVYKKEDYQIVWANVNPAQLSALEGFINKKVEIVDHLLAVSFVYVDGIDKQYLISGTPEQRYAVAVKVREV